MARETRSALISEEESCVEKLAQLIPHAIAVRIPVQVTALRAGGQNLKESTLIEFGSPTEVIFASTLPLEFNDRVRLQDSDGSLHVEALVVAVQYGEGRRAVAARFVAAVRNWIIKR